MDSLTRYDIRDSYVLEELRRQYQSSDPKGRIRLLKQLQSRGKLLPEEIQRLAIEDENTEIRQWVARHGKLLEEELKDRLKNDPDPFVRACLKENPDTFGILGLALESEKVFLEATHLERLAFVRNPSVADSLIEKIFNPDDRELGIGIEQRAELALAFLSNREAIKRNTIAAGLDGEGGSLDGSTWWGANKLFRNLWEHASKWPNESKIPYAVYKFVPTEDETKAKAYASCTEGILRGAILENCSYRDSRALKLGIKDDNETCRMLAYSKIHRTDLKDLEAVLKGTDTSALSGLAQNVSLSVQSLQKVSGRLMKLGDDMGCEWAHRTIKEREKATAPDDPEALFGWEGREGDFLEDKVDFIWKRLGSLQKETAWKLEAIGKELQQVSTIIHTVVLYGGLALFLVIVFYVVRFVVRLFLS